MNIEWDIDATASGLNVGQWIVDTSGLVQSTMAMLANEYSALAKAYVWGRHDGANEVYATGGIAPKMVSSWDYTQAYLLVWALDGLGFLPSLQDVWNQCIRGGM